MKDLANWASADSCDTFASCQTHPFMSQEELEQVQRPSTSSSLGKGATTVSTSPWGSPRKVRPTRSSSGDVETSPGLGGEEEMWWGWAAWPRARGGPGAAEADAGEWDSKKSCSL